MQLNAFQRAAIRTYKDGAFAHIDAIADAEELKATIDDIEDVAFHDILRGLADPAVDTKEKAVMVLREAVRKANLLELGAPAFKAA